MVVPMAKLVTRFVMVIIICEPVETADTSKDRANRPTIIRSTAPYIDCRNMAKNTGSMNPAKGFSIFPVVKSFSPRMPSSEKKDRISHGRFSPHLIRSVISTE